MKKQLLFLFFALLALCASAEPNDVFSVGDITYSVILDSYSGKPGIVSVKSLSAQGKAKTSLKLDIPGVVYYSVYAKFIDQCGVSCVWGLYGIEIGLLRQCHAKFHFCGAWFLPGELGHDPIREQGSPQLKGERPKSDRVRLFFNN